MSFSINKSSYTFKPTEDINIGFKASDTVTYGYLYGLTEDAINSTSVDGDIFTFPPYVKEGTYTCYIGAYVGPTWEQTGNFELIIKKETKPIPPVEPPTVDFESTKTDYNFTSAQNVVITLNQACKGGYLYGDNIHNSPLGCITDNSTSKDFGAMPPGNYTCYLGAYINGKWVQTGNFNITITKGLTPTPTPEPEPEPNPNPDPEKPTGPTVDPIPLPTPTGNVKKDLQNIKADYDSKYTSLVNNYNSLLKLDKIKETDKANLKVYISDFQKSNAAIYKEFEKALDNINANRTNDLNKVVSTSITQLTQNLEGISTEVSTTTKKLGVVNEAISTIEQKNNLIDINVKNLGDKITGAEAKLTPTAITMAVTSNLQNDGSINGTKMTLTKDWFAISGNGGLVKIEDGTINAYNSNNIRTYFMNQDALAMCSKINGDQLGIVTSVYKVDGKYNADHPNNNICWTDPNGHPFAGVGFMGGDLAGFVTMGIDNSPANDNSYLEAFRVHKDGWMHMGTSINMCYEHTLNNASGLNPDEWAGILLNRVFITGSDISTNSHDSKDLWLNNTVGPNAAANNINGGRTHVGDGRNSYTHGSLYCGYLKVDGMKQRIVDCGDLGYVGMQAYETPTPYFGDFGSAKTDKTGVCYVMFEREQMEVSNTNINYNVQITVESDDLNAKVQISKKSPNMVKFIGTPNTKFDYQLNFVQRGFENIRFKRDELERSLKTNFEVNEEVKTHTSAYKNRINPDNTLAKDIELQKSFNLARLNHTVKEQLEPIKDRTFGLIDYMNRMKNL